MSEVPSTPQATEPASPPAAGEGQPPESAAPRRGLPGWLVFLLAGVVAAAVSYGAASMALERGATRPLPPEYESLSVAASEGSMEADLQVERLWRTHQIQNLRTLLLAIGGGLAVVFGVAAGVRRGSLPHVALGVTVGGAAAVVVAFALAAPLQSLDRRAVYNQFPFSLLRSAAAEEGEDAASQTPTDRSPEMVGMVTHSVFWSALALVTGAAVGGGMGSFRYAGTAVALAAVAGALAIAIYVVGGGSLDHFANIHQINQLPRGQLLVLWASLPPLLTGMLLSRVR